MRINNLSARIICNAWFTQNGMSTISGDLCYLDFATELRKRVTKTVLCVPFSDRADATKYIRDFAYAKVKELHSIVN